MTAYKRNQLRHKLVSTLALMIRETLVGIYPSFAHADSTLPLLEHLLTLLGVGVGLKDGAIFLVDGLQLAKLFPDVDGKACCDGGSESGSLTHRGSVDGDVDDVRLCLGGCQSLLCTKRVMELVSPACRYLSWSCRHQRQVCEACARYPAPWRRG
jgi:hypothetical protein